MVSKMASTTQSTDMPHDENRPSIPHTWTVYVDLTLPPNRRETVAIMTRKYPTSLDVKVFKSATYLSPSSVVMAFKLFGIERVRVFGCVIDKKKSKKESRVRCLREDGVGFEACDVTTLSRVKETIQELGVEGGEYDEEYEDDVARTLAAWQHYQSDPGEQAIKLLEVAKGEVKDSILKAKVCTMIADSYCVEGREKSGELMEMAKDTVPEVRTYLTMAAYFPSLKLTESVREIAFVHGVYQHFCFKAVEASLDAMALHPGSSYPYELISEALELLEKPKEAEFFRRKAGGEKGEEEEEEKEGEGVWEAHEEDWRFDDKISDWLA
ncbi:hypothetical protein TrVE_jg14453 [Triparma verrucosa]|uniref:Uncharacterized protein n=1 Tax=Triparma verrucosa TaxID=1606542 RepID=A0A9W7EZX4_9STRA|nr:hypothetical protein TrVE_jg14453 [Triparma verrucosa]